MKFSKSILGVSILALTLAGCSTYQAPQIPTTQMAHIKEFDTKEALVIVHKIDGVMTKAGANEYGLGMLTAPHKKESYMRTGNATYDLAPGHRFLDLLIQDPYDRKHRISFTAQAGKSYRLKYVNRKVYVEEASTGKEVPTSQHY